MTEHKRSRLRTVTLASRLLVCLGGATACGESASRPMAPEMPGPQAGATDREPDASVRPDASTHDAGRRLDAAASDAADGDAGVPPSEPLAPCDMADEQAEHERVVYFDDEAGFALTPGLTGFGVAFQSDMCGGIGALPVAASGSYRQPTLLFGGCQMRVYDLSVSHESGGGYRMAWVDNALGSTELRTLSLSETLEPLSGPTRITTNQWLERRPSLWQLGNASYLSWLSGDPDQSTNEIWVQPSDGSGVARALVSAAQGFSPQRFALAPLGLDRAALAFVSEQAQPGVWLVPLDAAATPAAPPLRVSVAETPGSSVDLATREGGGAVVYTASSGNSQTVRFRRLDNMGSPIDAEVKLVSGTFRARDAAITPVAGGYAVAFRAVLAEDATKAEIRLMFITKEGTSQRDSVGRLITYHLADAAAGGGRLTARVSVDGQLLIGFLDSDGSHAKFRLLRERLDCWH